MQVYNYETSGAATFHMAVADYQRGQATGRLMRYEGGRYYGGPELIGHEAGDAGEVKLDFATPTRGTLQFPGEPAVAIQRYQFGAAAPQPESLLGKWMFFTRTAGAWPTSGWTVSLPPSLPRLAASSTSANTPMAKRCNATAIHPSTTTSSISSRSTAGPLARTP